MKRLTLFLVLISLASCLPLPEKSKATLSSSYVSPDDILVASLVTDSIYQFNSNGDFIRILYRLPLVAETIGGLSWAHSTNEILVAIDGTPDRVVAISTIDGSARDIAKDAGLTGTIRSVTQLTDSRDIIVSEGATIERFNEYGQRLTYGSIWPSSVHANSQHIVPLDNGSWLSCSSTAGIRIFPDSVTTFTPTSTIASAPAGTTGSYGCAVTASGEVIVSWYGASTDYLTKYSSTLTNETHLVNNNQGILADPRGVGVMRNGDIVVADYTKDYLLRLNSSGTQIGVIGLGIMDAPYSVLVVPGFSP
jgi:hypothetical protein